MGNATVMYREKKPGNNSWVRWFVNRTMRKNNNNLVSVVGKTGSGKTWSAMSICEMMAKKDGIPFTVEHIVFSLKELMLLINSGTLKRGSKIIFDEPQVSISAREFQSEANKVFNYLLTTFRHKNLSLFFCTPFETLLDKNTRRLFHVRIDTDGINLKNNTCRLRPRYIEYTDWKPEPYRKRLIVNFKGGSKAITSWDIQKPSPQLIKDYEQKKLDFTTNLNLNIMDRMNKYEEKGKSMTTEHGEAVKKPLTPKQEIVFSLHQDGLSVLEIAKKLGITQTTTYQHLESCRKKGYDVKLYYNALEKAPFKPNPANKVPQ